MRAWLSPGVPRLDLAAAPEVRVHDTASGELRVVAPDGEARMYVCGITPYDATHIGHAATYIAFDLLNRAWRDAGHEVLYVQNVTDIDDPLLERANATGDDWRALADRETDLFRADMAALGVLAPAVFLGATEAIPLVTDAVQRLVAAGAAYGVDTPDAVEAGAQDVYFDVTADQRFGAVSGLDEAAMLDVFPDRGGDPDRPGKRNR